MKGRRSNSEESDHVRSPNAVSRWRAASEHLHLPGLDFRRFSEWPAVTAPGDYKLSRIDQVSITIELVKNRLTTARTEPKPKDELPNNRLNILCCGQAAPIAALMLLTGARRVEAVQFGFEPVVILCELNADSSLLDMPSFPATFTREEIAGVLADPETLIDCLVWYDIGDEKTLAYLDQLTKIRDAMHAACSIIALKPCVDARRAQAEFAAMRAGKSSFRAAADAFYREVSGSINEHRDLKIESPLQNLLKGNILVVSDIDLHDV